MSINERLFHWLWKKQRKLRTHKEREFERLYGIELQPNSYRFSLRAFAIAGKWLDISAAEGVGGFIGNKLYLPRILCLTPDLNLNQLAYFYRIIFSITSQKMGLELPQSLGDSPERKILDFVLISSVENKMQEEFPKLAEQIPQLKQSILAQRVPIKKISRAPDFFEFLNQYFLGANFEVRCDPSVTQLHKWIVSIAENKHPLNKEEPKYWLQQLKDLLAPLPFALTGEGILPLWGRLSLAVANQDREVSSPLPSDAYANAFSEGSEIEKKPTEGAKLIDFDEENSEALPVQMIIEQLKTLEKYLGGKKDIDASDELELHSEALEEVDVREVFRSKRQAHSIFKSDFMMSSAEVELKPGEAKNDKTYFYDEWDYQKKKYRPRWCQVFESEVANIKPTTDIKETLSSINKKYRKETKALKQKMESLVLSRAWKNRQSQGDEIDLDQLVDRYALVKSGRGTSDKLYRSRRKSERDVSILLLLDMSLSTGSWIDGQQIMKMAQESLVMMHNAFSTFDNKVALAGFYSHARSHCTYIPLKDFHEHWDTKVQARLLSLAPSGYTRIGPALRHSIEKLKKKSSARKAILLITDGKPTDFDAYEGRQGIEDVRHAVLEASGCDISVFGLAIDKRARTYFPRMFGNRHFSVLSSPRELPEKLLKWYQQLFYGD